VGSAVFPAPRTDSGSKIAITVSILIMDYVSSSSIIYLMVGNLGTIWVPSVRADSPVRITGVFFLYFLKKRGFERVSGILDNAWALVSDSGITSRKIR